MIKQKLVTIPGTTLTGTEINRAGGVMPSVASVGSGQALPYLNGAPAGVNPITAGTTTDSMSMFSGSAGYSDTGATGH